MKKLFPIFFTLLLSLSACDYFLGEEIGRLEINQVSSDVLVLDQQLELDLLEGEKILVWSDMDVAYEGKVGMFFDLFIYKDGEELERIQFDPRKKDVSVQEVKTELNGKVDWKFQGKNGTYTVKEDGMHTFKGVFYTMPNVTVEKAEIFFRK